MLLGRTTKAIPAEVLEQAVVGSIRIVEGERKFFGGVKLKAQLIDPSRADGDGRLLLAGLFPFLQPGHRVRVRQHRHPVLVGGAEHPQARERGARAPRSAARGARERARVAGPRGDRRRRRWCSSTAMFALFASVDPLIPILLIVASGLACCSS